MSISTILETLTSFRPLAGLPLSDTLRSTVRCTPRARLASVEVISDELLEELGIAGTPEEARGQFGWWESLDAVDVVTVMFQVRAGQVEILATTEALASTADR